MPPAFDWRAVLGDPNTPVAALLALAGDPAAEPAALIALSGAGDLLRRAPALVGALYRNPRTPTSAAHRAILDAARAGLACEDLPELAELATVLAADPTALDPAVADAAVAEALQAVAGAGGQGDAQGEGEREGGGGGEMTADAAPRAAGAQAGSRAGVGGKGERRSATIDFTKLKLYEKIRLATLGNAYCRQNLMRDANRMVALAAIRSPQLTDGEVVKAAGNRALSEDVIRYIANRKEMVKQYAVKAALVGNAKCPLAIALRLLPSLHGEDIKGLARSRNIPAALSAAAKKLAAARGPQ